MTEDSYWRKLRRHPGVPIVTLWIVGAFCACLPDWKRGLIAAGLTLVIFGSIVLWTARSQP
jgi:hypothetical protein